ncbi:5-hydroxytryptamine receptor 1E-like [Coregonus clupeaformis]|uniref:5-hydroxytryptamine receptor 1E-like n=1 Tax=Coregonus clupeaformis TaxID=59861 RepID=UPI001E1C8B1E|nr:5-hydroxytryptamine receptor 1E-like [Coregonus clupeaformis]
MSEPGGSFKMEPKTDMVLVVIFLSIVTLITALMNSAVILAIMNTKKLHLPANYLICSLAVTDFLVAILVMPLSVLYIATKKWLLGCVVCEAWLSVDMTCCTCSILHLCAIALDRHWAITNAVEYSCKRTPRHVAIMVTIVWTISVLISVPPLLWRHSGDDNFGNYTKCLIEHDHIGFTIYSTFGAFYIPMALILILYYRIFIAARTLYHRRSSLGARCKRRASSHKCLSSCRVASTSLCASEQSASDPTLNTELNILNGPTCVSQTAGDRGTGGPRDRGTCDERTQICASRERKAARTLGLILGAFILCWLPFFVKELLVGLQVFHASAQVSDFLTWLGYVNSLINPLLYTSFNEDFKQAFKKLLRCNKCR